MLLSNNDRGSETKGVGEILPLLSPSVVPRFAASIRWWETNVL